MAAETQYCSDSGESSLSWNTFIVLHSVVHVKSVTNDKRAAVVKKHIGPL